MDEDEVRSQEVRQRSSDELAAAIRATRTQAEACRERTLTHDRRMESVMEMLSFGWQGPQANEVLRDLEEAHQTIRGHYLAQAQELEAQSEDLEQEYRRTEEEEAEQTEQEETWD